MSFVFIVAVIVVVSFILYILTKFSVSNNEDTIDLQSRPFVPMQKHKTYSKKSKPKNQSLNSPIFEETNGRRKLLTDLNIGTKAVVISSIGPVVMEVKSIVSSRASAAQEAILENETYRAHVYEDTSYFSPPMAAKLKVSPRVWRLRSFTYLSGSSVYPVANVESTNREWIAEETIFGIEDFLNSDVFYYFLYDGFLNEPSYYDQLTVDDNGSVLTPEAARETYGIFDQQNSVDSTTQPSYDSPTRNDDVTPSHPYYSYDSTPTPSSESHSHSHDSTTQPSYDSGSNNSDSSGSSSSYDSGSSSSYDSGGSSSSYDSGSSSFDSGGSSGGDF